jgi:hypothetical protein
MVQTSPSGSKPGRNVKDRFGGCSFHVLCLGRDAGALIIFHFCQRVPAKWRRLWPGCVSGLR